MKPGSGGAAQIAGETLGPGEGVVAGDSSVQGGHALAAPLVGQGQGPLDGGRGALLVVGVRPARDAAVPEIGQRRAPPQRKGLMQGVECLFRINRADRAGMKRERFEPIRVEFAFVNLDQVARGDRHDPVVAEDVNHLFNALSGYSNRTDYGRLLVAPHSIRKGLVERIDREIENHRAGREAWVRFKINSLVDEKTIDALYRASQAGVPVDVWVRGICAIKPGVPGLSGVINQPVCMPAAAAASSSSCVSDRNRMSPAGSSISAAIER